HGPQGHLAFAPRLTPEDFRAAFTTAEGWGTFTQKREGGKQTDTIELKSGRLSLHSLEFAVPDNTRPTQVTVTAAGQSLTVTVEVKSGRVRIALAAPVVLAAGQSLQVQIS
nr:glucosylceramidase [Candidatus Anammoximicrobium sp.]